MSGQLLEFIILDIPEGALMVFTALALFNMKIKNEWRRFAISTLVYAVWGRLLSLLGVVYQPKLILVFLLLLLLFRFVWRQPISLSLAMAIGCFSWFITAEALTVALINRLNIDFSIFETSSLLRYSLSYLYLAILASMGIVFWLFKFDLRRLWPKTKHNRLLLFLVASGGLNFLVILFLNVVFVADRFIPENILKISDEYWVYQALSLVMAIVTLILFWKYLQATVHLVEQETEAPYSKHLIDLSTAVRSIKHDALNHFTVILGFLRMGDTEKVMEYVQGLVKESRDLIDITEGVKNKTVSALLYGKKTRMAKEGIDFQVKISPRAPQFEGWKDIDTVRVLGNLLDNAIGAATKMPMGERYIRMEWNLRGSEEYLYVENSGPTIPEEDMPHLFNLGYSTKEEGGGIGLPVVKSVVAKYRGSLEVFSKSDITRFTVIVKTSQEGSQKPREQDTA
ncbi:MULTISPECIES: sensor histidine kinase [Brevibacillus]|uniref:sensor histidine kinase n=1 Tax=Brevibacillus TaxID=55080 RepID=UPI0004F2FCA4|nr:ATP-binding protein [Brevibacillus borstelensis]KKX53288.1 hypothetical protein X546_20655 [Brevibacillus borstelensis cifa_chp40]